jgi:hypothetical protein
MLTHNNINIDLQSIMIPGRAQEDSAEPEISDVEKERT